MNEFERGAWSVVPTGRGDVVIGRPSALTRTRLRWAAAAATPLWLAGIALARAAGLGALAWAMVAVVALVAVGLLVRWRRELLPSRAERVHAAAIRREIRSRPVEVDEPGPSGPVEAVRFGAAWRERRAIEGRRPW